MSRGRDRLYFQSHSIYTSSGIGRNLAKIHVLDIDNWITG